MKKDRRLLAILQHHGHHPSGLREEWQDMPMILSTVLRHSLSELYTVVHNADNVLCRGVFPSVYCDVDNIVSVAVSFQNFIG